MLLCYKTTANHCYCLGFDTVAEILQTAFTVDIIRVTEWQYVISMDRDIFLSTRQAHVVLVMYWRIAQCRLASVHI